MNNKNHSILSRVRIARNIKGLPFSDSMTKEDFKKISDTVRGALGNEYTYINFSSLSPLKKASYVECHLVSHEFANSKNPTSLYLNQDRNISIMVGEEDHIRIQGFADGNNIVLAMDRAKEAEEVIAKHITFAYSDRFGYITKCPTNLGSGIRASVMMFLPFIVNKQTITRISSDLTKSGMTIRGVYGEGSSSLASLYQISNSVTLGIADEEITNHVSNVVKRLEELEEKHESEALKESEAYYKDYAMRAYGLLKNSYIMTSKEAISLISRVMLGHAMGCLETNKNNKELFSLLEHILPATLTLSSERAPESESELDIQRAGVLRESL